VAARITTLTDQVAQRLQDEIQRGVYEVGTRLPSGREWGKAFRREPAGDSQPETVQREYVAIYEAIRAGDPQAARAAVLVHLEEAAVHLGLDLPQRNVAAGAAG